MSLNISAPPNIIKEKYEVFKEEWKKQSICVKLSKLAYYYSIHYYRLNYYYYFDYNKYTSYKSFLWFIQEQDKQKQ
jgi:hypothetical protein